MDPNAYGLKPVTGIQIVRDGRDNFHSTILINCQLTGSTLPAIHTKRMDNLQSAICPFTLDTSDDICT